MNDEETNSKENDLTKQESKAQINKEEMLNILTHC